MGRRHKGKNKHKKKKGNVVGFHKSHDRWGHDLEEVYASEISYQGGKGGSMIKLPKSLGGKEGKQAGFQGIHYPNAGGGSTTYVAKKPCNHPGDKVIFEFEGKKLFASNMSSLKEYSGKWNLIIDLAGILRQPSENVFIKDGNPKKFDPLKKFTYAAEQTIPSEVLRLNWPDMGAPSATLDFWLALWKILPEKTVIACHGGHGRTGTCIASLMIAAGVDYYSAVDLVRADHCEHAIETFTQEKYLHNIYVTKLERELLFAQGPEGNAKDVVDIQADLSYAEKNKPIVGGAKKGGHYMGFGSV